MAEESRVETARAELEKALAARLPASGRLAAAIEGMCRAIAAERLPATDMIATAVVGAIKEEFKPRVMQTMAELKAKSAPKHGPLNPERIGDPFTTSNPRGKPVCTSEDPAPPTPRGIGKWNFAWHHPAAESWRINDDHDDWKYVCPHCQQTHISEGPDA